MIGQARKQSPNPLEDFRNEIKVPLDREQYEDFMPNLYRLGLYPNIPFPDRRINSVYFDTINFTDYEDNTSGIGDRRKTRVRWYNGDMSKLTLEQKIKNNKASRKENIRLRNPSTVYPGISSNVSIILDTNESTDAKALLETVHPVLEVQYDRQYFTLGPDLRMTIDKQQCFKRLYPAPLPYFIDSPVYAVVEFKFPATDRARMHAMLRDIPNRVFRHSKYVIGMDCTVG